MKLQQLPTGARFEYEGQTYVKTGPLTASSENGGRCMIPRYAVLKPLDALPVSEKKSERKLDERRVVDAFEDFYRHASEQVSEHERAGLLAARARFFADLAIEDKA